LQKDLSAAKSEVTKVESSMVEALAAKNSEIETLVSAMDALKNQAALNEGKLSSLQVFRPLICSFFFCVLPIIAHHESLMVLVTSCLQLPFSFSTNQLLVKSFTTFIRETWSLL